MMKDFIYYVCPAHSVADDINDDCQYIIISSGNQYDDLSEKENVLILHFADTEVKTKDDAVRESDTEKIFSFLENCRYEDVFISCDEGQSRSPAVAAALLKCAGHDDSFIWESEEYRPNLLVYYSILKYYNSKNEDKAEGYHMTKYSMFSYEDNLTGNYYTAIKKAEWLAHILEIAGDAFPDFSTQVYIDYPPLPEDPEEFFDDHGGFFVVSLRSGEVIVQEVPII